MRIYMLGAKGFPAASVPGGGGVERHVEEIATRLADRGHHVFVYVRSHSADPDLKEYKGVNLIRLPSWRSKNLDTFTHVLFSTFHVLFQKADIIHYHGIGPATLAWIPRLFKWRAKIVVTFHSRDRMDPKWSWLARAYLAYGEWAAMHFPHETIVVSHVLQVFCRELYGRSSVYIPNGAAIPSHVGTDRLKQFGLRPNQYLLSVGRLVPNKAYDLAMAAYARVPGHIPYAIAGDAEYADAHIDKLKHLASRDPRVKLIGFQSGENLNQLLAHCYAFVHPSRAEGLSTAVLEAMAHGKTVIMSNIKENLELVDSSGLVFPLDDKKVLEQTLDWALHDPEMVVERGERARQMVQKYYSWTSVVDRLERLYRSLF